MPSLQCPECRREILPNELDPQEDRIICEKCGRRIYEKINPEAKMKCPKCGEMSERKDFEAEESCGCA